MIGAMIETPLSSADGDFTGSVFFVTSAAALAYRPYTQTQFAGH